VPRSIFIEWGTVRYFTWVVFVLTHRLTNPKQKLVKDKHSSLFCLAISDEDEKFFNVDTWLILALGIENFRKTRMNLLKRETRHSAQ
jgi:hypothetical protein